MCRGELSDGERVGEGRERRTERERVKCNITFLTGLGFLTWVSSINSDQKNLYFMKILVLRPYYVAITKVKLFRAWSVL